MNILLVEPFFEGSHAAWAEGYQRHSRHRVELLTLTGRFWKWRMHGGAVTLAQRFLESDFCPDRILASDMCDLGTFLALTRERTARLPTAVYFHENQLSYPWSPDDPDPAAFHVPDGAEQECLTKQQSAYLSTASADES